MPLKEFSFALSKSIKDHVYGSYPVELYEPIDYIMNMGGKRVRPLLTLLTAGMYLDDWKTALKPAMAIEVFHNFTLMHDDIMDQAPLRRGNATVHEKWDTNRAILSGDVMLVAAYRLLENLDGDLLKRAFKGFNRTAAEVCEGQQLDMLLPERPEAAKEDYLEMIRLKTSVLLGFAMELGGIVSGQDEETCRKLFEIGVDVGLGFQQMDDVLDLYGDPEKFGKQIGGDIIENKKTWLVLRAAEKVVGTPYEKDLYGWFAINDAEAKVKGVREIFNHLGIKEEGVALANGYFNHAIKSLNELEVPFPEIKETLIELIHQIKNREK